MLETIDACLDKADRNPSLFILIATALRHNWHERNEKQFKGANSFSSESTQINAQHSQTEPRSFHTDHGRPPDELHNTHGMQNRQEDSSTNRLILLNPLANAATINMHNTMIRLLEHYDNHLQEDNVWGSDARITSVQIASTISDTPRCNLHRQSSAIASPGTPTYWEWSPSDSRKIPRPSRYHMTLRLYWNSLA
ncbi:hypothetical protein R1sor_015590 [Riccia sorocarpa]|uniref:Uncharacterized protein n=1 Tax=Riccia sorocarpa TaxID=122646 RepID=A0ABD3HEG9_9MARC